MASRSARQSCTSFSDRTRGALIWKLELVMFLLWLMRSGSCVLIDPVLLQLPIAVTVLQKVLEIRINDPIHFLTFSPYASHPFALSADAENGRQKSEVTCSVHPAGRKRDLIRRLLKREISHGQVQDGLFFRSPGADRAGAGPEFAVSLFFGQVWFGQVWLRPAEDLDEGTDSEIRNAISSQGNGRVTEGCGKHFNSDPATHASGAANQPSANFQEPERVTRPGSG